MGSFFLKILAGIFLGWLTSTPCMVYSNSEAKMNERTPWLLEVNGWRPTAEPDSYDTRTIFNYMDGAAELYLAFNLRELRSVRFEKPGRPSIFVEVYEMASPEDAYGVFTFEQQDPEVAIGQGSEFGGGLLRFWKGQTFVAIFAEEPTPDAEETILAIARRIEPTIVSVAHPPKIMGFLPDAAVRFTQKKAWFLRSHIHLNQRFFLARTNILMLGPDVESVLARYDGEHGSLYILLVRYPSTKRADMAFQSFMGAYMPDATQKNTVRTENGRWSSAGRFQDFLVAVFDANSESTATHLVKATLDIVKKEGL